MDHGYSHSVEDQLVKNGVHIIRVQFHKIATRKQILCSPWVAIPAK